MSEDDEINFYPPGAAGLVGKGLTPLENEQELVGSNLCINNGGYHGKTTLISVLFVAVLFIYLVVG